VVNNSGIMLLSPIRLVIATEHEQHTFETRHSDHRNVQQT
jgi:hypothetical protein